DYGTADLMTSTAQLLIPLLTLNIQDAVLRFSLDKTKDPKKIISIGCTINSISMCLLGITLFLLSYFGILSFGKEYIIFLFFSFAFGGIQNSLQMYMKAVDNVKVLVYSGLASTLFSCVSNLLLLLVFKVGILGYLISNLIGHFVAIFMMFFFGKIYRDVRFTTDTKLIKEMFVYSAPLAINSVAWWINTASDKYIITFFCGAAINGIYSVAYKIPTILSTFQTIFYNAWSVSAITEFDKDDKDGFIGNIYSLYMCVSTIGCSLILIFNKFLASMLYAKDFYDAWRSVPFLLLGVAFNGIALFEGCLFTAVKKTKEVSRTTIVGAIVNTIANFILIPLFASSGAAFATMIGYLTVWIVRTISLQKIVHMRVNWMKQVVCIIVLVVQVFLALKTNIITIVFQISCLMVLVILQYTSIKKVFRRLLTSVKR
ncbi:polysaccharide biosynthesis C-terminal domain-containing protein, partial [Ruminococcus bicirculans (ex Wegman et al. 2014)]